MTGYSKKMCYEYCLQFEFIKTNCSCIDPSIPVVTTDTICNTNVGLGCVATMRSRFDSESLSSKNKDKRSSGLVTYKIF